MESLIKIIGRLRASEIQFIRHFYSYRSSKNFGKRKRLFEGIVDGKLKTNEQAMNKLFDKPSASAFSQLKSKCKQEVVELMILHDGAVKSNLKGDKKKFESVHGLSKLMILQDRGLMDEAIVWGERLKKQAVESENYSEAALIYDQLDNPLLKYAQPRLFEKLQAEALQLREAASESFMARYQWSKGVLPPSEYLRRRPALELVGKDVLPELERKLESIKSNKMDWHYHLLAAEYTLHAGKMAICEMHIAELQVLIDAEKSVTSELSLYFYSLCLRLAIADDNLDDVEMHSETIATQFAVSTGTALDAMETCYFSLRHGGFIEQASTTCNAVLEHESLLSYSVIQGKWTLYKAACQFGLKSYPECAKTLNQSAVGYNGILGGSIAVGILEIMCMIEREQYDRLEYRIQAFLKMMKRKSREDFDNDFERVKLIEGIIQKLLRYNFDFNKAGQSISEPLLFLHSKTGIYSWNKYGLELIPFHRWANEKLAATGFKQFA